MGSIPLVANTIQTPTPRDPLQEYARVAGLKSQLQGQQIQQQEIQQNQQAQADRQAATKAMLDWDGKSYETLANSILQNGGSANAAQGALKQGLSIKDTASQIAQRDADTGSKQIDTILKKHDAALGAIQGAEQVPDAELGQHVLQTAQQLAQSGMLEPELAQQAQQISQLPPDQQRQSLKLFEKNLVGSKEQFEQAQKAASQKIEQQKADQGEWKEAGQGTLVNIRTHELIHGVAPVEQQELQDALNTGKIKSPSDFPGFKAQQEARATQPYKIATAEAEGKARQLVEGMTKPVYAINPKTQQRELMSATDAIQSGVRTMLPVTESMVSGDIQLNNRLGDVRQKLAEYEKAMQQDLSASDRGNIAGLLGTKGLKVGAFGTELPMDRVNAALSAENIKNLSPAARDALISYRNVRESLLGYNKVLSGGSRSSDKQFELNDQTIPDPSITDVDFTNRSIQAFRGNLGVVGQGLPKIPGIKTPDEIEQQVQSQSTPSQAQPQDFFSQFGGKKR